MSFKFDVKNKLKRGLSECKKFLTQLNEQLKKVFTQMDAQSTISANRLHNTLDNSSGVVFKHVIYTK